MEIGWDVAEPQSDLLSDKLESGGDCVAAWRDAYERFEVGREIPVALLGLEVLDKLGVAVDAILHVVVEGRDDQVGLGAWMVQAEPEVEKVTPFAALAERTNLRGEDLIDGEGADLGAA